MTNEVDIIENSLVAEYGKDILDILLVDHSVTEYMNDGLTHNIFWATHDYEYLGEGYAYNNEIKSNLITGDHSNVIMPRVMKKKTTQSQRVKKMAEVFTPAWVCNIMNNNIDEKWFGRRNVFNIEDKKHKKWETLYEKITFPKDKTWEDYIKIRWMEITCGEGPFMTSRYDATTGKAIALPDRIGFVDRKMRIINENTNKKDEWYNATLIAYQNILAYEWQGDNLLLARESLLYTFIDNFQYKFKEKPSKDMIEEIADIISWNVWQMDGLKGVIPNSCHNVETKNLYGDIEIFPCPGCKSNNIHKHNGIPVLVKSWYTGKRYPFHLLSKKRD